MKIVYATYVDNQKQINYPVDFLLKEIPELIIFTSDQQNQDYLSSQDILSQYISKSIRSPEDISIAQNMCIDTIFKDSAPDFVIWLQADTYITEEGHAIIRQICVQENINKSFALNSTHLRLFHICHSDYFGVTIFGKNETARFTGDGAHTPITGQNASARLGSNTASIDIGYLTINQCRNHLMQHQKTWGYNEKALVHSDVDFVMKYLKNNDIKGFIKKDDIFYEVIKKMGLLNEYDEIKELCRDIEFSKYGRLTAV